MKAFLRLDDIRIENANAIAGMTYGFPAITSFLGFSHALSRKLHVENPALQLGGCAVVSREQQLHIHRSNSWKDAVFCLTRNPPTKEGVSAPFNEEGRMHLTVSLLIECNFDIDDLGKKRYEFEEDVKQMVLMQRIAGGLITQVGNVEFKEIPEDSEELFRFIRREMRKLLPGFLLVERSDLLVEHLAQLQAQESNAGILDAWLDFVALKHQAQQSKDEADKVEWNMIPKPAPGWLVPITTGYRAISELYSPGQVRNTRDPQSPFRFVESVYTIGQWLSPHRVKNLEQIFWRYHAAPQAGWYLCKNSYFLSENNSVNENKLQEGERQ